MTTSNPDLPEPVAAEMKAAEAAITSGKLKLFAGETKDQEGTGKGDQGAGTGGCRSRADLSDRRRAGNLAAELIVTRRSIDRLLPDPVGDGH
ncbi:hypothetical protein AS026_03010 [Rhizobium altiplani]|uniref:Uncharacterized protein n=1 Tax=Rhizobium altiplani TaxID=1864509 RepID=A0A109JRX0_9HYPH|nr:hypothetical protein [Rhizobium altiplani]KWV53996.1 hypothetical protein AS026_03010 [Rhizobium altiplani]